MSARFTIVLPVHNGGEHVKHCVASILGQRRRDFELLVLENASTDGTAEWLRHVGDPRVAVSHSERLLPIEENWGRALTAPKREFMVFIGHDDLLDPDYLDVMDRLIAREPQARLYFAHFRYIDEQGRTTRSCRPLPARETAAEFAAALFAFQRDTYGAGYLYRARDYERVGGIPCWKHLLFADDTLWMTLMEDSWKATAPEECFSVRVHPESYGHRASWRDWAAAMHRYDEFLRDLAGRDPAFAAAFSQNAPRYFVLWCNSLYRRLLADATDHDRRVDPQDVEVLADVLRRTSPRLLHKFKGHWRHSLDRRRVINRFAVTRGLYLGYRKRRYGPPDAPVWL